MLTISGVFLLSEGRAQWCMGISKIKRGLQQVYIITVDFDPTGTLEPNFIACKLNEILSFVLRGLA